jgi:hypothetical protein
MSKLLVTWSPDIVDIASCIAAIRPRSSYSLPSLKRRIALAKKESTKSETEMELTALWIPNCCFGSGSKLLKCFECGSDFY